jgi:hypothetical protein
VGEGSLAYAAGLARDAGYWKAEHFAWRLCALAPGDSARARAAEEVRRLERAAGITFAPAEAPFEELSSATDIVLHPDCQKIIGMGKSVLPKIFKALDDDAGDWHWVLQAITGADPVPKSEAGDVDAIRRRWLDWAIAAEYLPVEARRAAPFAAT